MGRGKVCRASFLRSNLPAFGIVEGQLGLDLEMGVDGLGQAEGESDN
jgi:hypothetical protein